MFLTPMTDGRTATTVSCGRYTPLVLAGIVWLSVALFSHAFSALNVWLVGIAFVAALVHFILPVWDNDAATTPQPGHKRDAPELSLTNVLSSVSIAASLTIVVVFLLQ